MTSIKILMAIMALLSSTAINAQIKNTKTASVKIYGNCQMCEVTIERAGNVKNAAEVDWNKETKMATITYDANLTNPDEILKRIALAGYDSDQFLAPDKAYAMLSECCQYERINKKDSISSKMNMQMKEETDQSAKMENHASHNAVSENESNKSSTENSELMQFSELQSVFELYFEIKDALVQTDGKAAASGAKSLTSAIEKVKMSELIATVHDAWMENMNALKENTEKISKSIDAAEQREFFSALAKPMYELMKVSNPGNSVFYQRCPMYDNGKGANWLSREKTIKNPYYGATMLTCGSTIEEID